MNADVPSVPTFQPSVLVVASPVGRRGVGSASKFGLHPCGLQSAHCQPQLRLPAFVARTRKGNAREIPDDRRGGRLEHEVREQLGQDGLCVFYTKPTRGRLEDMKSHALISSCANASPLSAKTQSVSSKIPCVAVALTCMTDRHRGTSSCRTATSKSEFLYCACSMEKKREGRGNVHIRVHTRHLSLLHRLWKWPKPALGLPLICILAPERFGPVARHDGDYNVRATGYGELPDRRPIRATDRLGEGEDCVLHGSADDGSDETGSARWKKYIWSSSSPSKGLRRRRIPMLGVSAL